MGKHSRIVKMTRLDSENQTYTDNILPEPAHCSHNHSNLASVIWPSTEDAKQISAKGIAHRLAKVAYFPESWHAPFMAAQYAVELAAMLRKVGTLAQLHALLANAHEAYLGHIPPVARAAELAMTTPPLVTDRRDVLQDSMHGRIMAALQIPDFGTLSGEVHNSILYARDQLDATLERDLGAVIYRTHSRAPAPLARVITPYRWDHTIDRYLRCYSDFTALCGLPDRR